MVLLDIKLSTAGIGISPAPLPEVHEAVSQEPDIAVGRSAISVLPLFMKSRCTWPLLSDGTRRPGSTSV